MGIMAAPRKFAKLVTFCIRCVYAWRIGARDRKILCEHPENRQFFREVKVTSRKLRKLFVHTWDWNPLMFAFQANALPMS